MEIKVTTARKMLDRLGETLNCSQDYGGFREMSETMNLQNSDYLYKKIHLRIRKERDDAVISLSATNLNLIAKYIGFQSFREFEASLTGKISPQMESLIGSYYCYVRANMKDGKVLRSPVRIWKNQSALWWELKGPVASYSGKVDLRHGCLFILMTSQEGKAFYHVYKIGNRSMPEVLQGVFSGVSTAFDPIGGRTVLIRQGGDFAVLTNARKAIGTMRNSKQGEERLLASYFNAYSNNNVAPGRSSTFGLDDLL